MERLDDPERHALSEDERKHIFAREIVPREFPNLETVSRPSVTFVGGQPGAGKTALERRLRTEIIG